MALFSLAILPSPTSSCLGLWGFCRPPSVAQSHSRLWHPAHSSNVLSLVCCQPRASLSASDPQPSDGEDPFSKSEKLPEEDSANSPADPNIHNNESLNPSVVSSGPPPTSVAANSVTSSSTTPVNNVVASQVERDRHQDDLREILDTLSRSLQLLSSTLSEISLAVGVLSATLGNNKQLQATSPSAGTGSHSSVAEPKAREAQAGEGISPVDAAEPWLRGSGGPVDEDNRRIKEDVVPSYLVEQNDRAHKLAYMLQQAFIQARIEGLGKPFQVAAEEFVQGCIEAHGVGIGLKELQLHLILQDGSLTGAFAIRNQRWSEDPIFSEESRVRSLWVRLVYSALAQLGQTYREEEEMDPIDAFVKQVLQLALEQGYDLERLKLEQAFAGPDISSGAVKTMRGNQYLILLTLEKVKSQDK